MSWYSKKWRPVTREYIRGFHPEQSFNPSSKKQRIGIYLWSDRCLHPIVSLEMYYRLSFNYSSVVILPDELIAILPQGDIIHDASLLTSFLINGRVYSAPNGLIYYGERHKLRKIGGPAIFAFYRWRVEEIVHLTREEFHNCRIGEPIL